MAGKTKPDEMIKFGAEFDADAVIEGMRQMSTGWGKQMRAIEKKSDEAMKGAARDVKQFIWQVHGAKKAYKELYETQTKALKGIGAKYDLAKSKVDRWGAASDKVGAKLKALQGSSEYLTGDPKALADAEKLSKRMVRLQKGQLKEKMNVESISGKHAEAAEGVEEIKKSFKFPLDSLTDAAIAAGAELWGPFDSLLKKDLPGAMEKGGKLAGLVWEKSFKAGGHIFKSLSKAVGDKGGEGLAKTFSKRWKGGGIGGKAGAIGGAAVGGLAKAASGLLNMVSKLGPLLASVSTLAVGLVQLFIDAEAAAKDFNSEIMSTTGNADFLNDSMGNVTAGATKMEKSLAGMYEQATEFNNIKWGITKEQYTATSNAITAEGVSLKKLSKEYENTTGYVKNFGSLVKMSVSYSKAFGISLQEVGQFEGEMMSELGMNIDQVESGFQGMLRGAEEAGIASNKFFGIVRGFSTDLTYFTVRMESVTKMMTALGKSMSPREAQKFLQGITGFFKGKDLGELTVDVLMGGGAAETNKGLQKSMDQKLGSLAQDIAKATGSPMDTKDLKKVLKKSDKDLATWLAEDGAKLSDDQKKAIRDAAIQQQKILSNNPVDTASALADLDPFETMERLEAISVKMFGKTLDKVTGVQRMAVEATMHVTDEQQKGFRKLNMGVESMKADLIHKLTAGVGLTDAQKLEKGLNLTADETEAVNKLYDATKEGDAATQLKAKSASDIWNAMSSSQKKLLEDGSKQMDFQEKTAGNTTSIMTRLQILVDWFMRTFYQTILGIWETIADIFPWQTDATQHAKDTIAAAKSGNMELANIAASSATHEEYEKRANEYWASIKTTGQKLEDTIKDITTPAATGPAPTGPSGFPTFIDPHAAPGPAGAATPPMVTLSKESIDALQSDAAAPAAGPPVMTMADQAKATEQGTTAAAPSFEDAMGKLVSPNSIHVDVNNPPDMDDLTDLLQGVMDNTDDSADSLDDIWKALRVRGIKLDKPFLENNIKSVFTDATYEAASDALTDYYFLSHANQDAVIDAIHKGADPKSLGKALRTGVMGDRSKKVAGKSLDDALQDIATDAAATAQMGPGSSMLLAKPNAAGGMVTAVQGGLATVRPAPGEGLASVGKGESIGRAGGGGGGGQVIELRLKGDLARIIDARSHNAIAEHERMKTRR